MTNIVDILASTVVFLFSAGADPAPIGTGFIVGYPSPDNPKMSIPLVVTAKHVVGDRRQLQARFSTQKGESTALVRYDIPKLKASNDLWEHPDDGVDLLVFRSPHFRATKYVPLPMDLIASKKVFQDMVIRQTDRVIFPSLLVNFMGSSQNYPVFRDGTIALIPKEKVPMKYKVGKRTIKTKQEVVLADATSVPGASGCPVFLSPNPRIKGRSVMLGGTKPYLLGVMHGFYPALPRDIIEIQTSGTKEMYAENSGIAILFPSWRLKEILELKSLAKRMAKLAEADSKKGKK